MSEMCDWCGSRPGQAPCGWCQPPYASVERFGRITYYIQLHDSGMQVGYAFAVGAGRAERKGAAMLRRYLKRRGREAQLRHPHNRVDRGTNMSNRRRKGGYDGIVVTVTSLEAAGLFGDAEALRRMTTLSSMDDIEFLLSRVDDDDPKAEEQRTALRVLRSALNSDHGPLAKDAAEESVKALVRAERRKLDTQ